MPQVLSQPISLSRVQSSYQAGNNVTITYTVSNNQRPTLLPDIPAGATVTDTVNILASFVITDDANTLRGGALTSALTTASTLVVV